MKTSSDFVLRKIAGEYILVPTGASALAFGSMASTNDVGYFMWSKLEKGCSQEELVAALLDEYDVDRKTTEQDVNSFLEQLRKHHLLEE